MAENREHIEAIIIRKLEGIATKEELQTLDTWLEADEENRKFYRDYERIYNSAVPAKQLSEIDVDREWEVFKANLEQTEESQPFLKPWLRIAASMVIIATLGYLIWINAFQSDTITVYAKIDTKTIVLPDSSLVTLNVNSSLTYNREFEESRDVRLEGEAFFDVRRDEDKPFLVSLPRAEVKVLGTSFNIEAYEDLKETIVIVNSGRVQFKDLTSSEAVVLEKGEKGILDKSTTQLTKGINVNTNYLAWKSRYIVFDNTELSEVIRTLKKVYKSEIILTSATVKDCRVTATFENQSLKAVLTVLEQTLNLEYRKKGDIIEVIKADC